jgi:hypothetical protein
LNGRYDVQPPPSARKEPTAARAEVSRVRADVRAAQRPGIVWHLRVELTGKSTVRYNVGTTEGEISGEGACKRRKVQKDLDIAEYTDPEHNPMIPHVIVLEPGLVIFKIYNGYWFFGRPTIEELRQDLRAALKKCRPDWDIAKPELKAAWERGEHDHFYPYGKTYGQVFREQE